MTNITRYHISGKNGIKIVSQTTTIKLVHKNELKLTAVQRGIRITELLDYGEINFLITKALIHSESIKIKDVKT